MVFEIQREVRMRIGEKGKEKKLIVEKWIYLKLKTIIKL